MELKLHQYILHIMTKAHYEYDSSVGAWAGWIKGFPGIYAQGGNVEEVRSELISVLEDYLLMDLKLGKRIPGISFSSRQYAKTH